MPSVEVSECHAVRTSLDLRDNKLKSVDLKLRFDLVPYAYLPVYTCLCVRVCMCLFAPICMRALGYIGHLVTPRGGTMESIITKHSGRSV